MFWGSLFVQYYSFKLAHIPIVHYFYCYMAFHFINISNFMLWIFGLFLLAFKEMSMGNISKNRIADLWGMCVFNITR